MKGSRARQAMRLLDIYVTKTYTSTIEEMNMTAKQFNDALTKLRLPVYASAPVLGISLRQAQR